MINPHHNPTCSGCGDELKIDEQPAGVCFTCSELEKNRRYRQHNGIGEYAAEVSDAILEGIHGRFSGVTR